MSLQVCHCGWCKVTTYQGLRTHQGKMGCTPKGARLAESDQQFMWTNVEFMNTGKDLRLDVYTAIKTDTTDLSFQVCHCGWTKMTTYQGLRTHQGMMGCTAKGMRMPKKEQYEWKNQWEVEMGVEVKVKVDQRRRQPTKRATVKEEVNGLVREPLMAPPAVTVVRPKDKKYKPQSLSQTTDRAMKQNQRTAHGYTDYATTTATIKKEPKSPFSAPQPPFQRATKSKSGHQLQDFSIYPQAADSRAMTGNRRINSRTDSASIIKEELRSPSVTLPYTSQLATNSNTGHQRQDFSAGVETNRLVREHPITPPPVTVVRPKEKDRVQTLPRLNKSVSEHPTTTYPATAERPKEKHREHQTLSQEVPVSSSSSSAATATIKEEPKSPFAIPPWSFPRAAHPESDSQLQDFSTGVQVNRQAREDPPTPPPATVVQPEERDGKENVRQDRFTAELQQKIQMREEKMRLIEGACENTTDSTSTSIQTDCAAEEATTQEDPKSLGETAQPDVSTGVKVKELARMFSASTTQETAVGPKDKNRETQILSKEKRLAQKFSATAAQETEVQQTEKDKEGQNPAQNVPDLRSTAQANSATANDDPKPSGETAEPDFSSGMKVKELARMFSATTTQETAVRSKEKHREKQILPQAKLLAQRFSATAAQQTEVRPKEKDREDQKPAQKVPDATSVTTKMNPAAAKPTVEEDPKPSCETVQLSDFSTGVKVKELARMFSAIATQKTTVQPREKHQDK